MKSHRKQRRGIFKRHRAPSYDTPPVVPEPASEAYQLASARLIRVLTRGFEAGAPETTPEVVETR